MTKAERQKLVQMIRDQRPQWEILREFPEITWESIVMRFYRDGNVDGTPAHMGEIYKQPLKYSYKHTWYDTEEYQQSLSITSSSSVLHGDPIFQ